MPYPAARFLRRLARLEAFLSTCNPEAVSGQDIIYGMDALKSLGNSLLAEPELVNLIQRHAARQSRSLRRGEIGIGDDAAAVYFNGHTLILTTDSMVDGVHFRHHQISWHDLGWKSIASNQSDIAAMGANPEHAMLSLGLPHDVSYGEIDELLSGIVEALDQFGGCLVGGDTVFSPVLSVGIAMTGSGVAPDQVMRRSAASPGDMVVVSGYLGASAGGLAILNDGSKPDREDAEQLLQAHFTPYPRTDLTRVMVQSGIKCAMDISDGLLIDLERICAASKTHAVIYADQVPIAPALISVFEDRALEMALTGGEDYELLYAANSEQVSLVNSAQSKDKSADFGIIGEFVEPRKRSAPKVEVVDRHGDPMEILSSGWDHFSRRAEQSELDLV